MINEGAFSLSCSEADPEEIINNLNRTIVPKAKTKGLACDIIVNEELDSVSKLSIRKYNYRFSQNNASDIKFVL